MRRPDQMCWLYAKLRPNSHRGRIELLGERGVEAGAGEEGGADGGRPHGLEDVAPGGAFAPDLERARKLAEDPGMGSKMQVAVKGIALQPDASLVLRAPDTATSAEEKEIYLRHLRENDPATG